MGMILEAERLAGLLQAAGVRATHDVAQINPAPCLLVEPVPARDFDAVLDSAAGVPFVVTWRVIALAPAPASLRSAAALERLVDHAAAVLAAEGLRPDRAVPASYVPGAGSETAYPAVILTLEGEQTWQA